MSGTKEPGAMTREMVMVHTAFRREFGLMPELVKSVPEGDRQRTQLVVAHMELIGTVLEHHHEGEDRALWPRLLRRCPDEIRPLVHGMEKQHERIATLHGALRTAIAAWRIDANAAGRDAVLGILGDLLPALREHLAVEEEYVLPLIEKHITAGEWDEMVAGSRAAFPPDKRTLLFGMMMYEGDPATIRQALESMPGHVRPVIVETAPGSYGDYAERLYGTRTPGLT